MGCLEVIGFSVGTRAPWGGSSLLNQSMLARLAGNVGMPIFDTVHRAIAFFVRHILSPRKSRSASAMDTVTRT